MWNFVDNKENQHPYKKEFSNKYIRNLVNFKELTSVKCNYIDIIFRDKNRVRSDGNLF